MDLITLGYMFGALADELDPEDTIGHEPRFYVTDAEFGTATPFCLAFKGEGDRRFVVTIFDRLIRGSAARYAVQTAVSARGFDVDGGELLAQFDFDLDGQARDRSPLTVQWLGMAKALPDIREYRVDHPLTGQVRRLTRPRIALERRDPFHHAENS